MIRILQGLVAGCLAALLPLTACGQPENPASFDLVIHGGRILDGSGNPWFYGDVGVRDGIIVTIGDLAHAEADRIIDASGLVVAPGFIDIHSHADDSRYGKQGLRSVDARRRAAPSLVKQGITTVVVNQDGRMPAGGIAMQRAAYDSLGIGPNAGLLVGHNAIRRHVLGSDYRRPATTEEIGRMRALVRRGMEAGALGLSAALEYIPGRWSTIDEVVALVEEIVPYDGVYIAHQRSEGSAPMWWLPSQHAAPPVTGIEALLETIEIGERTGATVVASHIKARGADSWGLSRNAIALIEQARARGVAIYADQYPYTTSGSDGNIVLVPDWSIATAETTGDFAAALRAVLSDSSRLADLRLDIAHTMQYRGGAENIVVFEHPDTSTIGRDLAELAAQRDVDPVEMSILLQLEGFPDRAGGARLRGFSMAETDLQAFATQPWVATASDGGIAVAGDSSIVHVRFYSTFPRKIRTYAMDSTLMTVSEAVRSATSLPAQILGLSTRGFLLPGMRADIVIMDLNRIGERATFTNPHRYAEGIHSVLVGGIPVVDEGELTWALPGTIVSTERLP